jgi:hypothetical protein
MSRDYAAIAAHTVFMGRFIPAHDETHDLAAEIGATVAAFHAYVASVRDAEQADGAVAELLNAMTDNG